MRVTIREQMTVKSLLERAYKEYGSIRALRAQVRQHPEDLAARIALHDIEEYRNDDPEKVIQERREVFIPDHALDRLTVQRIQLLLAIKGLSGSVSGARELARVVNRDIKNVSEDIRALEALGLLTVEPATRGKRTRISLPGDAIDLHLIEAAA